MRFRSFIPLATAFLGASLMGACDDGSPIEPTGPSGVGGSTSSSSGEGGSTSSGGGEGGFGGSGQGGEGGVAVGGAGGTNQGGAGGTGGAGGIGSGGGGGANSTGTDTCPGDPYSLALGAMLSLNGSTAGMTGDYQSYCGSGAGSGPDMVYAITPMASGTMMVSLAGQGSLNGVVYAQETCGGTSFYCSDQGAGLESFAFDAQQGVTTYLVVDGRDMTAGDYVLLAQLNPPACGDGVINEPMEDCDFGDTNPGDGCDATCQFEVPADSSDTCPGQLYQASLGVPLTITGFTTGYTDNYTSCGAVPGSPDRVFAIFATATGMMTVNLPNLGVAGSGFDGVLAAWAATCDPSNLTMPPYLGCSDGAAASDTETLTFPVTSGSVYFVVVDGYANYSYGNFQLTATIN